MEKNELAKDVYIFSGLGADQRMFDKIHFSGYRPVSIKWIPPLKQETIEHYAIRFAAQITTANPILIGLSFGGIMAIEVAKHIKTEKIILIASAKSKWEIPFYFRWAGKLQLDKIIPSWLLRSPNLLTFWFFGVQSKIEKHLLTEILFDTDPTFIKWAINKIIHWSNTTVPKNIVHIHGTADKLLPFRYVSCDIPVANGGHFMTINKADELNRILSAAIN